MHSRLSLFSFPLIAAAVIFGSPVIAQTGGDKIIAEEAEDPAAEYREQLPVMPQPMAQAPAGHDDHHAAPAAAAPRPVTVTVALTSADKLVKDAEATYILALQDAEGKPVTADMLEEQHEAKVHVFVVDAGLSDFHHIHPEAGKAPGTYNVSFTPATERGYHIFADVKPLGQPAQLVPAFVEGASPCQGCCVERVGASTAEFGKYKAALSFAGPVEAGKETHGEIAITGADGKPVTKLEPVMGAFAHILAFQDDCRTALHLHAHGADPKDKADRGSAPVAFMLTPAKPGFLKIFVHVRIDGKDEYIPFGVDAGG